jgi:transcriptional regulator with XRE-family HTH domain
VQGQRDKAAPVPSENKSAQAKFGANIARLREARGMTQEQLGWAAGLHQTAVARIERSERKPRLQTILTIASALGVPPADLFAGIE